MALGLCTAVCVVLTLFAFQTKIDFTLFHSGLCSLLTILCMVSVSVWVFYLTQPGMCVSVVLEKHTFDQVLLEGVYWSGICREKVKNLNKFRFQLGKLLVPATVRDGQNAFVAFVTTVHSTHYILELPICYLFTRGHRFALVIVLDFLSVAHYNYQSPLTLPTTTE